MASTNGVTSELTRTEPALPRGTILIYCAPSLGSGFTMMFLGLYLMKYATDVLLISPAAMGTIFLVSRIWDAISDPMAGYLSDRTRTRIGRRRPWMLAGAVPVGVCFVAMVAPPLALTGTELTWWMGGAVVLFYTAFTVFSMPHDSLGAELSIGYEDRNRIFGWRRGLFGLGALGLFVFVVHLSEVPNEAKRALMLPVGLAAGFGMSALIVFTGVRVRERPEYQGRGARHPYRAIADVLRNRHARLLLMVFFLQQTGVAGLSVVTAYYTEYVLGDASLIGWLLGGFFVVSIASIPVWLALGRRFEKKPLMIVSMVTVGLTMGSMFFLRPGSAGLLALLAVVAGAMSGGLDVLFPSIQADVIDSDEHRTGERKEGVYFAVWNLGAKSAGALAAMIVGFALYAFGFQPNVEQSDSALLAIRTLMSLFPFACYMLGTLLFLRFGLDRATHARIRADLDERAGR